ncbi:MAG: hypothetical protein Q7W55_14800 [Pseudohongiella sp.]|nr:hypothetical protein [Pseudohongiella sp.]MDO9520809.1 hypothetical protein [Pseudohongiella sp.]
MLNNFAPLVLPAVASLLLIASPLHAQVFPRGNGIALTGKTQFDLYVQVSDWKDMPHNIDSFRLATLQQFEQTLQSQGIRRRPANRNYLVCALQATHFGDQVAYNVSVEYWELESTKVNTLQWQQSGISTVAGNLFSEQLVADECATRFLGEWSRWNQTNTDL